MNFQIIHLKRFQFHNGRWVKSQKIVKFPFRDFDPTGYLVPRQAAAAETNHCSASDAWNEDGSAGQTKQMLIQRNHNNNTEIADLSSCSIETRDKIRINGTGEPERGTVNLHTSLPTVVSENGKESRMECANGKAHLIKDKPTAGRVSWSYLSAVVMGQLGLLVRQSNGSAGVTRQLG